jgi:hypothetical protein
MCRAGHTGTDAGPQTWLIVVPPLTIDQGYMCSMSGLGIVCRRLRYLGGGGQVLYSVEHLPRCELLRLIPSFGGLVLPERRDL